MAPFINTAAFERRCIRSCCVALLAPYFSVRLSRAPCRRGASTLSVRRRIYERDHQVTAAPGSEGVRESVGAPRRGGPEEAYTAAVLLVARETRCFSSGPPGRAGGVALRRRIAHEAARRRPLLRPVSAGKAFARRRRRGRPPVIVPRPGVPGDPVRPPSLPHVGSPRLRLPLYEKVEAEGREGRRLSGGAEGHDRAVAALLAMPLSSRPGARCVYSDLGYILLGRAIEAAAFESLDRLLRREICGPLRMRDTGYLPLASLSECETGRLVSTGRSEVRRREKAGEVDDENAAAMGGVAGHAGVFSTAGDLFLFAREVLRARRGEGRVLTRPSAMAMTTRAARASGVREDPRLRHPGGTGIAGGAPFPGGVVRASRASPAAPSGSTRRGRRRSSSSPTGFFTANKTKL